MKPASRRVTFFERDRVSAEITIRVYPMDRLTQGELKEAADGLADDAMRSLSGAKYIHAPLSRIKAERRRD